MNIVRKLVVFLSFFAMASVVSAGTRSQIGVNVSEAGRYAYGSLVDARGSADNVQQISCWTNSNAGYCYAVSSANVWGSCYTTNPAFISVLRGISGESYVSFYWDAGGNCTYVTVQNASFMRPGAISGF
jgi:hypothetical protein